MKRHRNLTNLLVSAAGFLFILSLVTVGCRPQFPQCRDDDDCKAEEGNDTLMVCVNGQCQECAKDEDCPKDKPRCKENQCVECLEDGDCPEDRPFCENNQCVFECDIDSDCDRRGKEGMICKDHKCQWECESDADCSEGMECKNNRCVPKCCASDADCKDGKICRDCECIDRPACELQTIHFDFDRSDLRSSDRRILDQNAECLKQRPELSVTIEGHCDERGTEEYNISLGERRARSAMNYLNNLGIPRNRMRTISYGEGRPVCQESNERCWAENRRSEFIEQ